ncbi:MAG: DUF1553 domain-containing protein [Saprospiraceae bacterium]|nr:DUF1553 domain-containing protein [Saprospiraceae bacterium]
MKIWCWTFGICCALVALTWACQPTEKETIANGNFTIPEVVDFNIHIKPILSDRCFKCHGPDAKTREAGLGLHNAEAAFAALGEKKDHYAIVAGDLQASTLVQRIFSDDPSEVMPPPESNLGLSDYEKALLTAWVEQGATWKKHWAFIPPQMPTLPISDDPDLAPIDLFIEAKLHEKGLDWSPQASKESLIRRLSFDLRGIPPSPEEIDAFLADAHPGAYERVVDAFLDSDHYAERMALNWMDLARYADTHGYQDDFERTMWPWRDWVIHAFRKNMPYDTFIYWQLAGDLLPNPSLEQRIATGFNRNHKITAEGGVIDEEYRVEYVADRVVTVGTGLLGLTMECARCHDHKYDPISQEDFFSTYAFFNSIPEKGFVSELNSNPAFAPRPHITLTAEQINEVVTFIKNRDSLPQIELMVMREMEEPRPSHILKRGQYNLPGDLVLPAPPQAILPMEGRAENTRLDLADWLFDQDNPLTARVASNRLWQLIFGRGIVSTPFDFGNQGAWPTHPELLDYLALTFQENNWDIQALLKMMVLSKTYRQSVAANEKMLEVDPENQWLGRASRIRLKAEMIRDQALFVSGLLANKVGGPSVKPYQPAGLWSETTGGGGGSTARYQMSEGEDMYRKSMYTFWKRTVPPPGMLIMDAPTRYLCTVERQKTNTPLQALLLLNDPQVLEASKALAFTIWQEDASEREKMIQMFRRVTSQHPSSEELNLLTDYLAAEKQKFEQEPDRAEEYLSNGIYALPADVPLSELAAYTLVANTIFNMDKALTRG